jgi:hypothetical protein
MANKLVEKYIKEPEKERFRAPDILVRTYHEPDNRGTDHGTGLQSDYKSIFDKGRIDKFIELRRDSSY